MRAAILCLVNISNVADTILGIDLGAAAPALPIPCLSVFISHQPSANLPTFSSKRWLQAIDGGCDIRRVGR